MSSNKCIFGKLSAYQSRSLMNMKNIVAMCFDSTSMLSTSHTHQIMNI